MIFEPPIKLDIEKGRKPAPIGTKKVSSYGVTWIKTKKGWKIMLKDKKEELETKAISLDSEKDLIMQDLIRAKSDLKRTQKKIPKNEIQETDHKAALEHCNNRIKYLKRMLGDK